MQDYEIRKGKGGSPDTYVRGDVVLSIPNGTEVEEHPVLSGKADVTNYFGIVLDTPLAVAPSSEVTIYANIAADTGIFLAGGGRYKRIDTVSRWPKRFALYGNSSDGMVYRYFKTAYSETPPKPGKSTILAGLKLMNREDEWITVRRCLLDQRSYNLFYSGKDAVGELLEVQIMNGNLSIVRLRNRPSVGRARLMPYAQAGMISALEMRFGI